MSYICLTGTTRLSPQHRAFHAHAGGGSRSNSGAWFSLLPCPALGGPSLGFHFLSRGQARCHCAQTPLLSCFRTSVDSTETPHFTAATSRRHPQTSHHRPTEPQKCWARTPAPPAGSPVHTPTGAACFLTPDSPPSSRL